ncbi:hypothetical protein TNCV_3114621 [Trichonephila clavipes]|nr:hypothetical protein TNCV_3114621 [Trichonephila clavipes]
MDTRERKRNNGIIIALKKSAAKRGCRFVNLFTYGYRKRERGVISNSSRVDLTCDSSQGVRKECVVYFERKNPSGDSIRARVSKNEKKGKKLPSNEVTQQRDGLSFHALNILNLKIFFDLLNPVGWSIIVHKDELHGN